MTIGTTRVTHANLIHACEILVDHVNIIHACMTCVFYNALNTFTYVDTHFPIHIFQPLY